MEIQGIVLGRWLKILKNKVDNLAAALTGLNVLSGGNLLYKNTMERNM